MTNTPQTVSELFPSKWLKAADLPKPTTVKIASTGFETVYDPRSREHVIKLVVSFQGAKKRLIPNKTQAESIWAITGSERFADWTGHAVTLAPGRAHNGKQTIVISRPQTNGATPPTRNAPMPQAMAEQAAMVDFDDIAPPDQPADYYGSDN